MQNNSTIVANSTIAGPLGQAFATVAMTTAYSTICVIAFLGNVLVIYVVATRSYMKTTFNFLIVNMAIADLLVSVLIMPIQIKFLHVGQRWIGGGFGVVSCKWVNFSGPLSIAASIIALVAISLDRYFAIVYPFKHLPVIRNTKIITSLIWIFSALFMFPYLLIFDVAKSRDGRGWDCRMIWDIISTSPSKQFEFARSFFMFTLIGLYVVPLIMIASLYVRIGKKLSSRKIPGHSTAKSIEKARESKRKVLKMLTIVVLVFALCWLPAHLMHFVIYYYTPSFHRLLATAPYVEPIAFFLCHANSAINPCLYVTLNEKFKREFFNVLSFCFPGLRKRGVRLPMSTMASEMHPDEYTKVYK